VERGSELSLLVSVTGHISEKNQNRTWERRGTRTASPRSLLIRLGRIGCIDPMRGSDLRGRRHLEGRPLTRLTAGKAAEAAGTRNVSLCARDVRGISRISSWNNLVHKAVQCYPGNRQCVHTYVMVVSRPRFVLLCVLCSSSSSLSSNLCVPRVLSGPAVSRLPVLVRSLFSVSSSVMCRCLKSSPLGLPVLPAICLCLSTFTFRAFGALDAFIQSDLQ